MVATVTLPVRELKGFNKRFITAEKTETVQFKIKVGDLKIYDKVMNFVAEQGAFKAYVGGSLATKNEAQFELLK